MDALLAQGRQLWIPDLPGFGDSDGVPGGQDADTLVEPLRQGLRQLLADGGAPAAPLCDLVGFSFGGMTAGMLAAADGTLARRLDRKSTRLNSSHLVISYAVFCLKKKTH